jgi:hypothetical protein
MRMRSSVILHNDGVGLHIMVAAVEGVELADDNLV